MLPFIKKQLLYNKKFPISDFITRIDKNDSGLVDSVYDNLVAPFVEEVVFALVPILFFPGSLFAFLCFRTGFMLLHLIEKNNFGKLSFKGLSVNKLFIPALVSVISIISMRFDISLACHILMNALVTPFINKYTNVNFLKASLSVFKRCG